MINKKVQQIYDAAKTIDYFICFNSQIRDNRILAAIKCNGRDKALEIAMKLISIFRDAAEVQYINDTVVVSTMN